MKNPNVYVRHIAQALADILDFTRDGRDAFLGDKKTQNAVIRSFEVVGEAAKRLDPQFTAMHPSLPWRRMAGFRDILIHAYDRVDLEEVWAIVEHQVPALLAEINEIITRPPTPSP